MLNRVESPRIVGIVNITDDSFSDGGNHRTPQAAIAHARDLARWGADIVELGAASSHPDAHPVEAADEIERLAPVIEALSEEGIELAVDTSKPDVQRFAISAGVRYLNDIRGFPDPSVYGDLSSSSARLVVMHSIDGEHIARRRPTDPSTIWRAVLDFFGARLADLEAAGIARDRLILDPGMGFFLGSNPEPSLAILNRLTDLKAHFGCSTFVSVSRKSFLRNLAREGDCDIQSRTLAAELFAAAQGVSFIRTHDVRSLRQALTTLSALQGAR